MNPSALLENYRMQTWILGVSGGPDSMALLDAARVCGVHVVVAHVHYHQRARANRDYALVESNCQKHTIPFYGFHAPKFRKGNFQERARKYRLTCFRAVVRQCRGEGVLLAHHQDDVLETFLFQKDRQSLVELFGIQASVRLRGLRIDRPFLNVTKSQLIEYCRENGIDYGVDESNASVRYTRNRYRLELESYTSLEKQSLLEEIKRLNQERIQKHLAHQDALNQRDLSIEDLKEIQNEWPDFWSFWLRQHTKLPELAKPYANELLRQCLTADKLTIRLTDQHRLVKHYQHVSLLKKPMQHSINYQAPFMRRFGPFKITTKPSSTPAYVQCQRDDMPLKLVHAIHHMDKLSATQQHLLRRAWIIHKIPLALREQWPFFLSSQEQLVAVPLLKEKGCFTTDKIKIYVIY